MLSPVDFHLSRNSDPQRLLHSRKKSTSPLSSSTTTLCRTDEHDVMVVKKPQPRKQGHLHTANTTSSNPTSFAPHAFPDDALDPFSASLRVWNAIPQEARRAFSYFLNYPTPPSSPRRSSRSPRRSATSSSDLFPQNEQLPEGTPLVTSTSSSTSSEDIAPS